MIGKQLKYLRELKKKSQQEVCSTLNIEQSTLANYENDKRVPKIEILIQLAEYYNVSVDYLLGREDLLGHGLIEGDIEERGLDGPGLTDILSYENNEEKITTFPNKLAYQMDCNGTSFSDLAKFLDVPVTEILKWAWGKSKNYSKYYKKLSEYFKVLDSYWVRPCAISPGIEPTTQEHFLILRYRYQNTPELVDFVPIEEFFPNCRELSKRELDIISTFRLLNQDNKDIVVGELKKCLKEQRYESVAADEPLRKTGTDNPK